MPRDSSKSRSRSQKKRRYAKSSSGSERSYKRKSSKVQKSAQNVIFDLSARSDIKNHIKYENIRVRNKNQQNQLMDVVKEILDREFGPIEHVTKAKYLNVEQGFSFNVGFTYDKDAYQYIKQDGYINGGADNTRMIGKPTIAFQQCFPLIKDALKLKEKEKEKEKDKKMKYVKKSSSRSSSRRHRKYSDSSERDHKSKRKDKSKERKRSYEKDKKENTTELWIFGLPWSIKGKQVQDTLCSHPSGPFYIHQWRWIRVKDSNCEFMQITIDEKKAIKLLGLRDELQIENSPVILINALKVQTKESIKESLKQSQLKITFPEKVNPAILYKALNDVARVVQLISYQKLSDGLSNSYIVTLASASKARDIKRLGLLSSNIKVEEYKGQLVYRPTKSSKLAIE